MKADIPCMISEDTIKQLEAYRKLIEAPETDTYDLLINDAVRTVFFLQDKLK